jgi:O-antigen ligase
MRAESKSRPLRLSPVVAVLFAVFINQGAVYYVVRYTLGIDYQSPWIVFAAICTFTVASLGKRIDPSFVRFGIAFAMLTALYVATSLWSASVVYSAQKTLLTILVPPLCVATGLVVARDEQFDLFLTTSAVLAALVALTFLVNGHTPLQLAGDSARTTIITYQQFSLLMAFGGLWAITRLIRRWPAIDIWSVLSLLIFVYFILLSGGRTGLLTLLVGALAFTVGAMRGWFLRGVTVGILAGLAIVVVYALEAYAYDIVRDTELPVTLRRLVYNAFIFRSGSSHETRDVFYDLALRVFWTTPLIGVGWGGFPPAAGLPDERGNYPHNLALELLAETGIIGTAAFLLVVVPVLLQFLRSAGHQSNKNIILTLFVAGLAVSMVGGDWPEQRLLFFSMGSMVAFTARSDHRPDAAFSPVSPVEKEIR